MTRGPAYTPTSTRPERPHGTRQRYAYGSFGSDPANGCRCAPCTHANTMYQKRRRGPRLVDPAEVVAHVAWLRSRGVPRKTIAELAGVNDVTVYRLAAGIGDRVRVDIADRLLAVNLEAVRGSARYVDAGPTHALIEALVAAGWSRKTIAHGIGRKGNSLHLARPRVRVDNAAAVDAFARRVAPGVWLEVEQQLRDRLVWASEERERSVA